MQTHSTVKRVLGHGAAHAAGAFLGMGTWAFIANAGHPLPDALTAGLVQGSLSALITALMKKALDAMSARFAAAGAGTMIALPPAIVWSSSTSVLIAAHAAAGTPEILATIAVPASVSLAYAITYSLSLWHRRKAAA